MNEPSPWLLSERKRFLREQGFFDKNPTIRFLIVLFFMSVLFLFLHCREVHVDMLELNSIAPRYVVSQVDFSFVDDEATLIQRQEMLRDVGKIYQIPPREIRQQQTQLKERLRTERENQRKDLPPLDQLYQTAQEVLITLQNARFLDTKTLEKWNSAEIPATPYTFYPGSGLSSENPLPAPLWNQILRKILDQESLTPNTKSFLMHFFQDQKWPIDEDIPLNQKLRNTLQKKVPSVKTAVNAGDRIIDKGEKVTARHLMMLQAMQKTLREGRKLWHPLTILGSLILTFVLTAIAAAYFQHNHPDMLYSNRKLFLFVIILILTMILAKLSELFILSSNSVYLEDMHFPFFVPFAAILLTSLLNSSIATFASGYLTVIFVLSLAIENESFIVVNLSAAIVAIMAMHTVRRRKEIFTVCLKSWACAALIIIAMHFSENTFWEYTLFTDLISESILMLVIAVLVVGLLPLFESAFHIMTDVSLKEYLDPSNEILRRLSIDAPGTYQHSILLGNLAESAALAIGANGLFCRVACLYHDIGKMGTAQYFTENQSAGVNIHQLLTPLESAQVIMAHVPEGVALARKAGLPESIIDIIKEHHGTTLVYYFYRKQLDRMGGDTSLVDENEFRYPGPKPRTKESTIIMIADSIEAASRSLDEFTEERLLHLIDILIKDKWEDGQFDESLLTIEELTIVKRVLVKTLFTAGHSRIKYPQKEPAYLEGYAEEA